MAGILDFLQTPDAQLGIGLLAAGGPSTTPMNVGQRVQMAMQGVDAQKQNALKTRLLESQIAENTSQDAVRRAQIERQARQDAYYLGTPGAASTTATPAAGSPTGATPPGAALKVAVGKPADAPDPPQGKFAEWSKQYNIPVDALVADYYSNGGKGIAEMIYKRATPDMQVSNGYAYDKNKLGAGYLPQLNISSNGQATQVQIGPDGQPVVSAPRGAVDAFSAYQGAQANFKPIRYFNPQTQREEFTSEGAVVGGAPRQPMARTGNPMIDAVIQTESGGNPNAVSPKGAQGLMQVMPGTNSAPGFGVAPAKDGSEAERTRVGQEYLTALNQKYQNPTLAAIAYNWGPGNTDAWIKSGGDYNKLPAETKNYVSAVMTRTAVNGLGGQQSAPQSGNFAAGPSATEAATAKANERFQTGVADAAAGNVKDSQAQAQSAAATLQNVQQIRSGLDKAILGPGANARVTVSQLGQMLGITGKDAADVLASTRSVMQGLARQELSAAGQMKGQGQITESERAILRKAEAGEINSFTKGELQTMVGALEKTANYRLQSHEGLIGRVQSGASPTELMQVAKPPSPAPVASMRFNAATGKIEKVQ